MRAIIFGLMLATPEAFPAGIAIPGASSLSGVTSRFPAANILPLCIQRQVHASALELGARKKKAGRGWMEGESVTVGEEPLQDGLKERSLQLGGSTYMVVELEKTSDLVDDWIQNQMARVDPFGVVLWPAAQCIVSHLIRPPQFTSQKASPCGIEQPGWITDLRVVEVGAGTGLCSIAAAAAGARVLATDTNALTLDLVHLAASRQSLAIDTALFDLTGSDKLPSLDVLIGADCMYNKVVARALARRCVEAHASGARVLVGDSVDIARQHFEAQLAEIGQHFSTTDVPVVFTGSAVGADEDVTRSVTVRLYHLHD